MKVLFINERIPSPDKRGAALVVFDSYIQRTLAAGHEVLHVVFSEAYDSLDSDWAEYLDRMGDFPDSHFLLEKVPLELRKTLVGKNRGSVRLSESIQSTMSSFGADVTVCFDIESLGFARLASLIPSVVWLGDLAFQVHFHHFLEDTRRKPLERVKRFPRSLLVSCLWLLHYCRALQGIPTVIVCAKSSELALASAGLRSHYLPFPWPQLPNWNLPVDRFEAPTFLFFGSLSGLGSKSGIDFLAEEVLPALKINSHLHGARILLAGFHSPESLPAKLSDSANVIPIGYVEDLADIMARCHAVIFPIEVPVGNRTRIITAMSAGHAIIAHRNVALGNPDLIDGKNCLLASSGQEFVHHMEAAFKGSAAVAELGPSARETYLQFFSPEVAGDAFIREMENANRKPERHP